MTKTLPIVVLSAMLFSSCSLNRMFFQPDRIPANAKIMTIAEPGSTDTLRIHFTGDAHQPLFVKNYRDTIDLGYDLQSVLFSSGSGNQLNGWMLKPHHGQPAVTIVFIHGNGGNLLSQRRAIDPLVAKGFQVFMFDYSGYGFSQGTPTCATTLQDALSAIDYVKSREDVKHTKVVIYGQSLGGHLSAVAAEKRQAGIDALVTEGAFSSRKDIAACMARRIFLPGFIGRAIVNQPYAAKKSVRSFHKPLLVIHSTEDKVVPFKLAKRIYDNANNPKTFYQVKGPHIMGVQLYTDSIAYKINSMLGK